MNIKPAIRGASARRLVMSLVGSLVLAMMWGPQQGTPDDYLYGISQAVLTPRIFIFLTLGLIAFFLTPRLSAIRKLLDKPGVGLLLGSQTVALMARGLLHWFDPVGDGKFAAASAAASTGFAHAYFDWVNIVAGILVFGLGLAAALRRKRIVTLAAIASSLFAAAAALTGHASLLAQHDGIDHSYGALTTALAYCAAAVAVAYSGFADTEVTLRHRMSTLNRAYPGITIGAVGLTLAIAGVAGACWFSPGRLNATLWTSATLFDGTGISPIARAAQAGGMGLLTVVTAIVAATGMARSSTALRGLAAVLSLAGATLSLFVAHQMGAVGASAGIDGATSAWDNLGNGPWFTVLGLLLIAVASTSPWIGKGQRPQHPSRTTAPDVLGKIAVTPTLVAGLLVVIVLPRAFTDYWQQVLVTQIGVYVLLAVGLNVVVGWTGLLDLGFIAFYAIGSYTTAFLVGSLPIKPPNGITLTPLVAIPFAIFACIVAGVALGAPTLRLRGDYLAIVTLGFGEIIRIVAINNPGNITNSTRGPERPVPHPEINLGILDIKWGSDPLEYWYLLLFILGVVLLLFIRLERSSVGRAWAAVREDEVAARACGVDTTRAKLLAFAIGASTSGLAGVFFASQVGYFNPDNFLLLNSILVLAYVVFGGMGSMAGVIAGAAFLTWLPEFLKDQVPADDRQMWIGAVLLLMMIFRPAGVIPERRRKAELSGLDERPKLEPATLAPSEGL